MPAFLQNIDMFYGTGEKNAKGQTLEQFLEEYDPYRYKNPCCTADIVVFSMEKDKKMTESLNILLVRRSNHPSIGYWALPGGFVELKEDLDDTARRELEEETGIKGLPLEQFACYGDYDRDPRARVITTAYLSLISEDSVEIRAGDDAADAAWCRVKLEQIEKREEDGWSIEDYRLWIGNEEKNLRTGAVVRKKERRGLIREKKFTVLDRGMTAVDHSAVIVQAYLLLAERLMNVKP